MGDRFCEPLHLNLLSAFVSLLGSHRSKVAFDLVRRRHYAYSVLRAADMAMRLAPTINATDRYTVTIFPLPKTVGLTVARRITPALTALSNGLWRIFSGLMVTS